MIGPQKCRKCGCTEDRACITIAGPCFWVEPDLCSACAHGQKELRLDRGDLAALMSMQPIELAVPNGQQTQVFEFEGMRVFILLSTLQLALRHPNIPPTTKHVITEIAEILQSYLGVTENLAKVAQAGWDQTLDVEAERRIIIP